MDPYVEQRLRDEVLHLHSLWRRGPPNPTGTRFSYQTPQRDPSENPHIASGSEQPTKKKSRAGTKQERKEEKMNQMADEDQNEEKRQKVSDLGWTCMESEVEASGSGTEWPAFKAKSDEAVELTLEERATMSARLVQQRGVEASRIFFSRNKDIGSDDEFESEDESEYESEDGSLAEAASDECDELKFFRNLFEGDEELRGYYQKNWSNGEFCCLVCRGNGEKVTKKFRNCVAVVQHSVTISRTHKRRAHRAYGQVICNLLSWDINKLPADSLPVGGQDGLKLVESEFKEMIGLEGHGPTGGWDVKWPLNKKLACTSEWGWCLSEQNVVMKGELPEEEKMNVAAAKLQERSRKAARAFFSRSEFTDRDDESEDENSLEGSESDECEADRDDESEDENSLEGSESDECEAYKFLAKLFEEDQELRDYYKRSWDSGAFSCLVCWGIVEKVNKKYKDCIGLVQHCVSISRTKRKLAHRPYGKIICALLGWDINRLPASKLSVGDVIRPKSNDCQVEESSFLSREKFSGQHEEPQNDSSEKNSRHPEEPKKDSSWEKGSKQPEEPKGDCSVEPLHDGSVKTVSAIELGWAPFNCSTSQSLTRELTIVEQAKLNSMKVHQKSLDATRAFFSRDRGSGSDDDSQEEESGRDDLNMFFTSLLEEGGELIGYYQKNWENGDFSCLICGGAGENLTKKFKNLVAVVQHSVTIAKSKRIRAHRAYSQVICKALNWDIKRLPTISPPVEDNPSSTLPNCQGDARDNIENKDAGFQEETAN